MVDTAPPNGGEARPGHSTGGVGHEPRRTGLRGAAFASRTNCAGCGREDDLATVRRPLAAALDSLGVMLQY